MYEVGAASALPFSVEGQPPPKTEDPLADVRIVAPGYFETMKIRLIEGRFLDERDGDDSPRTSVINETMARRYFPDRSPLGQTIVNPHGKSVVVGVVARRAESGARQRAEEAGLPAAAPDSDRRRWPSWRGPSAIRCAFAGAIRSAVWSVDAEQPIYELSTMDRDPGARGLSAAHERDPAGALCRLGAAPGLPRHLRRALLRRQPADARDRAAHGARRERRPDGRTRAAGTARRCSPPVSP